MKNLLTIAGLALSVSANAQTQDTILSTKTSSIIEEKYDKNKTSLEKKNILLKILRKLSAIKQYWKLKQNTALKKNLLENLLIQKNQKHFKQKTN